MSNICSSVMYIYASKENEADLKKIYEILDKKETDSYIPDVIEKLNPTVTSKQVEDEIYDTAGWFEEAQYYEATEHRPAHIMVYYQSKWYPTIDAWDLGLKPYKVKQVTVAEEPGEGVYINTDVDHIFCSDKYLVDICACDEDPFRAEYCEYYGAGKDEEDRLIKDFNEEVGEKIGREFTTIEEIKEFIDDLDLESGWANFEEFTPEY